jgi:hypothetical protein
MRQGYAIYIEKEIDRLEQYYFKLNELGFNLMEDTDTDPFELDRVMEEKDDVVFFINNLYEELYMYEEIGECYGAT